MTEKTRLEKAYENFLAELRGHEKLLRRWNLIYQDSDDFVSGLKLFRESCDNDQDREQFRHLEILMWAIGHNAAAVSVGGDRLGGNQS